MTIVSAMFSLGHHLGMEVITEGIETIKQIETLRKVDCDLGQGYFISRPVPSDLFIEFLKEKSTIE